MNRQTISNAARPNIVSRVCAILSAFTLILPWLVRQSYSFSNPNPLIEVYLIVPNQFYILLEMAGVMLVDTSSYLPDVITLAAFVLS